VWGVGEEGGRLGRWVFREAAVSTALPLELVAAVIAILYGSRPYTDVVEAVCHTNRCSGKRSSILLRLVDNYDRLAPNMNIVRSFSVFAGATVGQKARHD